MRIGDVGSISPAGELAAFAVAVAVVVSISAFIVPDRDDEKGMVIGPEDIVLVSEWAGLDPDDDGIIELKDNRISAATTIPFPLTGKVGLKLSVNGSVSVLLFEDRKLQENALDHNIVSEVHEMMVLVQKGPLSMPGLLSIYKWEEVQ